MPQTGDTSYTPPKVSGYFNDKLYAAGLPIAPGAQPLPGEPKFTSRVVSESAEGTLIQWRVVVDDMTGGIGPVYGPFNENFNKYLGSWGGVYGPLVNARYKGYLMPAMIQTVASSTGVDTDANGLHSAEVFDVLFMGIGGAANKALFREAATPPGITAITYSPASDITCLAPVVVGSATIDRRLAVGRLSGNVQIIGDAVGTIDATMHNDTSGCWGIIQSFTVDTVYTNPLLIYSQNAIRYLSQTSVETAAPTSVLTNVPNGGYALGLCRLNGSPMMAFWVWPQENLAASMLTHGNEKVGRIVATNLETSTTYQEFSLGLPYVRAAIVVNESAIIATDGNRIVYYDGRSGPRDLGWPGDRIPNSDITYVCRALRWRANQLYVNVEYQDSVGATAVSTWEVYDFLTSKWHIDDGGGVSSSGTRIMTLPAGAIPHSTQSGFAYVADFAPMTYHYLAEPARNPFHHLRKTASAGASTGKAFYSILTMWTPRWELPGLEGAPKIVSRIWCLGDLDSAGVLSTDADISVQIVEQSGTVHEGPAASSSNTGPRVTWTAGERDRPKFREVTDYTPFYQLQLLIQGYVNNASGKPINVFPIIVDGYAFVPKPSVPEGWIYE